MREIGERGEKVRAGRTHVALVAVVSGLFLDAALVADLFSLGDQPVPKDLDVLHGLQQAVSAGGASVISVRATV